MVRLAHLSPVRRRTGCEFESALPASCPPAEREARRSWTRKLSAAGWELGQRAEQPSHPQKKQTVGSGT